jgi:DNA-binding FadR family transcriptional regulator
MVHFEDPTDAEHRQRWSDADREFHRQVTYSTGNTALIATAEHVAELIDEPLWRRLHDDAITSAGRTTLYLAEHRLIAAAIAEGDAAAAFHVAEQHRTHAPVHGA